MEGDALWGHKLFSTRPTDQSRTESGGIRQFLLDRMSPPASFRPMSEADKAAFITQATADTIPDEVVTPTGTAGTDYVVEDLGSSKSTKPGIKEPEKAGRDWLTDLRAIKAETHLPTKLRLIRAFESRAGSVPGYKILDPITKRGLGIPGFEEGGLIYLTEGGLYEDSNRNSSIFGGTLHGSMDNNSYNHLDREIQSRKEIAEREKRTQATKGSRINLLQEGGIVYADDGREIARRTLLWNNEVVPNRAKSGTGGDGLDRRGDGRVSRDGRDTELFRTDTNSRGLRRAGDNRVDYASGGKYTDISTVPDIIVNGSFRDKLIKRLNPRDLISQSEMFPGVAQLLADPAIEIFKDNQVPMEIIDNLKTSNENAMLGQPMGDLTPARISRLIDDKKNLLQFNSKFTKFPGWEEYLADKGVHEMGHFVSLAKTYDFNDPSRMLNVPLENTGDIHLGMEEGFSEFLRNKYSTERNRFPKAVHQKPKIITDLNDLSNEAQGMSLTDILTTKDRSIATGIAPSVLYHANREGHLPYLMENYNDFVRTLQSEYPDQAKIEYLTQSINRTLIRKQQGGLLPGYGGGDRRLILAEDGEFIVRKEVARPNLAALQRFNQGGMVQPSYHFGGAQVAAAVTPALPTTATPAQLDARINRIIGQFTSILQDASSTVREFSRDIGISTQTLDVNTRSMEAANEVIRQIESGAVVPTSDAQRENIVGEVRQVLMEDLKVRQAQAIAGGGSLVMETELQNIMTQLNRMITDTASKFDVSNLDEFETRLTTAQRGLEAFDIAVKTANTQIASDIVRTGVASPAICEVSCFGLFFRKSILTFPKSILDFPLVRQSL